jgi:hypothetical protein
MKQERRPPVVATWVLTHLSARYQRDALIGDLHEEYLRGRSDGWYWRQTLLGLLCAAGGVLSRNRILFLWWAILVAVTVVAQNPVPLLLILDPSAHFYLRRRRRRRRS